MDGPTLWLVLAADGFLHRRRGWAGAGGAGSRAGGGGRAGGKCATSGLAGARCIIALNALDAVETLLRGREQPVKHDWSARDFR